MYVCVILILWACVCVLYVCEGSVLCSDKKCTKDKIKFNEDIQYIGSYFAGCGTKYVHYIERLQWTC